jgi:hypothetical protein
MVFERQMLRRIEPVPDGSYRLTFRYYRFEEPEILRNLLYLGPTVRLVAPTSMQQKLADLLHLAMK